jgi:hypothetical protein
MGHRIADAEGNVRDSKAIARLPRDLDQVRPLLDSEKSNLRRRHGSGENELADAAAYVENIPRPGAAKELRRSPSDSHRGPESLRNELDGVGEDGVELAIVGVLQIVVHGAAREKHRPFQPSFSTKQRDLSLSAHRTLGCRQKGPAFLE